jgi:hypothetical protein
MPWDEAAVFELARLGEAPEELAALLRRQTLAVGVVVRHGGIVLHQLGMQKVLLGGAEDELVLELSLVDQREANLFSAPEFKAIRKEQHFAVRLAHRHLDGTRRLLAIAGLSGRVASMAAMVVAVMVMAGIGERRQGRETDGEHESQETQLHGGTPEKPWDHSFH